MKICRDCEQGRIMKAKIEKLDKIIYICEECDTVWIDKTLSDAASLSYELYCKIVGLEDTWNNFSIIELLE